MIRPYFDQVVKCDGLPNSSFPMYAFRLYAMTWCHCEVCNGGFSQLFVNSSGTFAPAAEEAFRLIGRDDIACFFQEAMAPFGKNFRRNLKKRNDKAAWLKRDMRGVKFDILDRVDELNKPYYALPEPYDDMDAYARRMVLQ